MSNTVRIDEVFDSIADALNELSYEISRQNSDGSYSRPDISSSLYKINTFVAEYRDSVAEWEKYNKWRSRIDD